MKTSYLFINRRGDNFLVIIEYYRLSNDLVSWNIIRKIWLVTASHHQEMTSTKCTIYDIIYMINIVCNWCTFILHGSIDPVLRVFFCFVLFCFCLFFFFYCDMHFSKYDFHYVVRWSYTDTRVASMNLLVAQWGFGLINKWIVPNTTKLGVNRIRQPWFDLLNISCHGLDVDNTVWTVRTAQQQTYHLILRQRIR